MNAPIRHPRTPHDAGSLLLGVLLLLGGCYGLWMAWDALQEAARHAPQLDFNGKYVVVGPPLVVIGMYVLVRGPDAVAQVFEKDEMRGTKVVLALVAIAGAAGLALAIHVNEQLQALGYGA